MKIPPPANGPVVVIAASIGAGHDGGAAEITRSLRRAGVAVERVDYLDLRPSRDASETLATSTVPA